MSRLVQCHQRIPSLVSKCLSKCKIVRGQIKGLLHIGEAQSRTGVVRFWVEIKDDLDLVIGDGWEEDSEFGGDVYGGVDAGVCLSVGFVLFVGDDHGAGKVEALLVELCFVCFNNVSIKVEKCYRELRKLTGISNDVSVNARLELISISSLNSACSSSESVEVNSSHAAKRTPCAANSRRNVLPECLSMVMTSSWNKTR